MFLATLSFTITGKCRLDIIVNFISQVQLFALFLLLTLIKNWFTVKATKMGCAYVTQLRLTDSRFCILCVRMNPFKAKLMVSSRGVDSKVLRMTL